MWQQYDHQVQLNTVLVPGGDAALLRIKKTGAGIAVCTDGNGRQTYLDPYRGGKAAVAEAARNVSCVGAKPIAITNCLNFGNPDNGPIAYQLAQAIEGMAEACEALGTPVISGNVSLYNESFEQPIYPTPVVGMLGVMDDVTANCTVGFKAEGDVVLSAGRRGPGAGRLRVPEALVRRREGPSGGAHTRRGPRGRGGAAGGCCGRRSPRGCCTPPTTAPTGAWRSRWPRAASPGASGPSASRSHRLRWTADGHGARDWPARPDLAFFGETPTLVVVSVAAEDRRSPRGGCARGRACPAAIGTGPRGRGRAGR